MKKEFVRYELAVKLKELGFDEPCLTCYDKLEMIASHSKNVFDYKNYNTSGYMVSRPTLSQAFKWFRVKYDLYSFVFKFDKGFGYEIYKEGVTQTNESFDTYEEAELACLISLQWQVTEYK